MQEWYGCRTGRKSVRSRPRRPSPAKLSAVDALVRIIEKQKVGDSYGGHLTHYIIDGEADARWFVDGMLAGGHALASSISLGDEESECVGVSLFADNIHLNIAVDPNDRSVPDGLLRGYVYSSDVHLVTPEGLHPMLRTSEEPDLPGRCVGRLSRDDLLPRLQIYKPAQELKEAVLQVVIDQYLQGRPRDVSLARYERAYDRVIAVFCKNKGIAARQLE